MPKPLAKFIVRPDGGWLYYSVFIWPNLKTLRTVVERTDKPIGCCIVYGNVDYEFTPTGKRKAELGEIHLSVDRIDIDTVCHECFHAAEGVFYRRKPRWRTLRQLNEPFAYGFGSMVAKIYRHLRKLGFSKIGI